MNRAYRNNQLKRYVKDKRLWVVFLYTVVLFTIQTVAKSNEGIYDDNLSNNLMLLNYFGVGANIYYAFLVFFAPFTASAIYSYDRRKNVNSMLISRMGRRSYIKNTVAVAIILGVVTGLFPLVFHDVLMALIYPFHYAQDVYFHAVSHRSGFLYTSNPYVINLLFYIVYGLWCIFFSLLTLAVSMVSRRRYFENILPIAVFQIAWTVSMRNTSEGGIRFTEFFPTMYTKEIPLGVSLIFLACAIGLCLLFIRSRSREDSL
ncbi:MAG: hypothetical protein SOW18_05910 [Peptoniphilus sp.]|nr:hypothetical protein [Peptoniphilus sp.]MDY3119052.1 hypothetical protein [Peptoniphilus sp.]